MQVIKTEKYKGSLILRISLLIAFVFLSAVIINSQIQIKQKRAELEAINKKITNQEIVNDEIRFSLNEAENNLDQLIEEYARSQFDYSKNGEQVFEIIGGN